jgi:formylglycine-generating enzyme required for sulfatase activity
MNADRRTRAAQRLRALLCLPLAFAAIGLSGRAQAQPPGSTLRDCATCPQMVVVPAGRFEMGTAPRVQVPTEVPAELEPVAIRIERPFALGRFEVTRTEYAAFARATGRDRQRIRCRTWVESRQGFRDLDTTWDAPNVPAQPRDDHPASCIDWHDARAYAAWLALQTGQPYRLPSEAEWEYAAKAGSRALQAWGGAAQRHCRHANSNDRATLARYPLAWRGVDCDDGFADVAPVGSFAPNAFGLHDMIGNVWEWAEDCSSLSYFGRPVDQRAWVWEGGCKRRIQRGGGWSTGPERSRPGFHGDGDDEDRADFAGFRVARDLP